MDKNYQVLNAINPFGKWVQEIKFDQQAGAWKLKLIPEGIIESPNFETIFKAVIKHGTKEIVWLVCEQLGVNYNTFFTDLRNQDVADARFISTYIILQIYPKLSRKLIAQAVGYETHSSVNHACKQVDTVMPVQLKLKQVYSAYPWLLK